MYWFSSIKNVFFYKCPIVFSLCSLSHNFVWKVSKFPTVLLKFQSLPPKTIYIAVSIRSVYNYSGVKGITVLLTNHFWVFFFWWGDTMANHIERKDVILS